MNDNEFNNETKETFANNYRETTNLFLVGLGNLFSVSLVGISLMIIVTILIPHTNSAETFRLFPYLGVTVIYLLFYSVVTTKTRNSSNTYKLLQILKRFFDLIIVSFSMFILAPMFILVSILIKVDSPGPILFRTKRVGQFGKTFYVYKFRTTNWESVEPHVTRVGKFLRRFSINELPMLYNVLEGEMSLVGPYPRSSEENYEDVDDEKKILAVKPGVTGPALISKASSLQRDIEPDLKYIENWSLLLDLKILLRTFFDVLENK